MLGILVILAISWVLLHFVEHKSLLALGLFPVQKRVIQAIAGFAIMGLVHFTFIYAEVVLKSIRWQLNPDLEMKLILDSLWYHLKSALTEELIFRGALLYILLKRFGHRFGLLISALAFGIYHLFSYGIIGGPIIPIIYVFLITGLMGYVWAYAFKLTSSIFLPLGLHLGWNFVASLFTKMSPYGELLCLQLSSSELSEVNDFVFALFKGFGGPLIILIYVWFFYRKDANEIGID